MNFWWNPLRGIDRVFYMTAPPLPPAITCNPFAGRAEGLSAASGDDEGVLVVTGDEALPARPAGAPDLSGDFYDANGNRVSTWPLPPSAMKTDASATTKVEVPATTKVAPTTTAASNP